MRDVDWLCREGLAFDHGPGGDFCFDVFPRRYARYCQFRLPRQTFQECRHAGEISIARSSEKVCITNISTSRAHKTQQLCSAMILLACGPQAQHTTRGFLSP